jgi:hypothetical protein
MKFNDETDADYMVRALRDNYNTAREIEAQAQMKREAAFEALMLAERAAAYLKKLADKVESQ